MPHLSNLVSLALLVCVVASIATVHAGGVRPSPSPDLSPEPSPSPDETPTPEPSPSPDETPTPEPSPSPDETPTPEPSPSPDETPTPEPSPSPDETPTPSPSPDCSPMVFDLQSDTESEDESSDVEGEATVVSAPEHLIITADTDVPIRGVTAFITSDDITYVATGRTGLRIPYDSFDTPCNSHVDIIIQVELAMDADGTDAGGDGGDNVTIPDGDGDGEDVNATLPDGGDEDDNATLPDGTDGDEGDNATLPDGGDEGDNATLPDGTDGDEGANATLSRFLWASVADFRLCCRGTPDTNITLESNAALLLNSQCPRRNVEGGIAETRAQRFAFYGNWCGPDHGGGLAIDALDEECRRHDLCYSRYGGFGWTEGIGSCYCDARLIDATRALSNDNRYSNRIRRNARTIYHIFNVKPCTCRSRIWGRCVTLPRAGPVSWKRRCSCRCSGGCRFP